MFGCFRRKPKPTWKYIGLIRHTVSGTRSYRGYELEKYSVPITVSFHERSDGQRKITWSYESIGLSWIREKDPNIAAWLDGAPVSVLQGFIKAQ